LLFYTTRLYYQYTHTLWLVLAIGIVVDDAIIVVEAVQHYIDEQGSRPKMRLPRHAGYIRPLVAIALILASVFVPVGFIPGIVGRPYQQFAITIAISVVLSRLWPYRSHLHYVHAPQATAFR